MPGTVDEFCRGILDIDKKIRFAGVASNHGRLIGYAYRKDLRPLLTKEESEISVVQSFIRMDSRVKLEHKLGKTVYAYALYDKVKRVTIPVRSEGKITHIFMVSFDLDCDHEKIVIQKILPGLAGLFR